MTKRLKRFKFSLKKSIPLWMVLAIVLNASLITGLSEHFLMRLEIKKAIAQLSATTQKPEVSTQKIKQEVIPQEGYKTSMKWGSLAKRLVEVGAIDKQKYQGIFTPSDGGLEMKYLDEDSQEPISINEKNSRFLLNTFWALGLTNKSKVLDEGPMKTGKTPLNNFASTAGWTLGAKKATELYSSTEIIPLTQEQQDLVKKIAENVFRPCCGNSTAFPDCNHGMAALGYIELAVAGGLSENQIYKDLLAFNSFWFPQTYIDLALYFDKQNIAWKNVDAKLALSSNYSSAQGYQRIKQTIQPVPGVQSPGGGCGV